MERVGNIVNKSAPRCPYCHEAVGSDAPKIGCESCMAWHHKECWTEHGACSACGFHSPTGNETANSEAPSSGSAGFDNSCRVLNCQERRQVEGPGQYYVTYCVEHALNKANQNASSSQTFCYGALVLFVVFLAPIVYIDTQRLSWIVRLFLYSIPVIAFFSFFFSLLIHSSHKEKVEKLELKKQQSQPRKKSETTD